MKGYNIKFEEPTGFLRCRIERPLWDHRGLPVFGDDIADRINAVAARHFREDDRVAILLSSSLHKVNGRHKTTKQAAMFLSENAATTWLNVGVARAA